MSDQKSRKVKMGSSRRRPRNQDENETKNDESEMSSGQRKGDGADSVSLTIQTDLFSSKGLYSKTPQFMEDVNPSLNDLAESQLSQPGNPYLLQSPDTAGKRKKMGSTRRNKGNREETDFGEKQHDETGDTETSLELQASIVEFESHSNTEGLLGPNKIEMDTESRSQREFLFASNTPDQSDDRCKEEVGEVTEPSSEAVASYSSEMLQDTPRTDSLPHLSLDLALQAVQGFTAEPKAEEWKKQEEGRQEREHAEAEPSTLNSSRQSSDQFLESDASTITEDFESFNNTIVLQSGEGEEELQPALNESKVQDDINSIGPGNQEALHQRDEAEDFVDLIVEENIVLAYRPHFRQLDNVESYQPERREDISSFLKSTPSDSFLGHDERAHTGSNFPGRRKMGSSRRVEEHGESKIRKYRYLYGEGEEVIMGKEQVCGIEETECEMSMEPKGSASGDEKEGEQMGKENFQTEEDTEEIGEQLEWDMGTVEGFSVKTLEKSLMLLEPEHRADEKGEDVLIEPTPFDHVIYSFGIEDQLYNKDNRATVFIETGNIETESNSEASMAHIVDPLFQSNTEDLQSGDPFLSEEEVGDYTLLGNDSEVSDSSQIIYNHALTIDSDVILSTEPNISPSQLIHTPCVEITNPFLILNPLLLQSIQGNEEDANTDSNTTNGLETSVILLSEGEVSDHVLLVNEVGVGSQVTYDGATLTTEPCQTDEPLSTDPNISASQLGQASYADESTNSFLKPPLLQRVQDQGDNAANTDSNQSSSPSRRRKMGSTRRHPAQREEATEEKQEEIKKAEVLEDKGEAMEFEMLMKSKDGAGKEKNEGDKRDENVLTDLSCSVSTLNQKGRMDGNEIESKRQSIINESMATQLILQSESELTDSSQTLHNPDFPTVESYPSNNTLNSNPYVSGLQHEETSLEVTLCESRESTDSPPDPPSLQSSLGPKETAGAPRRKRKMGSTRRTPRDRQGEERTEGKEDEKEKDTEVLEEVGAVMIAVEIESSIEKPELEEILGTVTVEQVTETIVVEGESALKSELVELKVREAEEVDVKIAAESESNQTPCGLAAQESGEMVCIDSHRLTQTAHMEQRLSTPSPSLPSKLSLSLSSQSHKDVNQSKATGKRRKMGSTRRTPGGLHSEEEKQETGEKVTGEEVREEAIGDPGVNVISERFQGECRAKAVSLEDQQERKSTEKGTIFIEVVPSSTALSGGGSEQVAAAPLPGQGNKRGQEKAERVEKSPVTREKKKQPSGTLGSNGSRSNPYNVVMVGNSSVGKTSFMKRFQSGEFCMDHYATIGIDTCIQPVTVDGSPVTLQLWDTAGQERYHSITRQVFHRAQGLVLMYDITSSQSFCDIRYWVNCVQEGAPDDVIVILLGNKADCANLEREVQTHEGENLATGYGMLFMECSAATGDNVTLSMETLARTLKQLGEETRQEEGSLVLQKEPPKKKSGCC
ncbi:uncharacterized protein rab44 isoform X1 [Salvelinus fontinalis]|uniref:uncharacterized protein rab44 isoform X1 n=1 Tax=Salvelinus fontinalis TaxID=8038 RepID=UPI002486BE7A|nr:uncharacterized protein rab44 isoform X1 [Salvelinus fontinalis]XP_055768358.1 uncharacterized protein rab44 isoform X1 [Salvelinus fontinalis]XP_055768359.1 uncharacterized protein rab44 isoform X1 [Salvelinus fontinalis]